MHHPTLRQLSAAALCGACAISAQACYTVVNPANQVIYLAAAAPIDMSYQIHERLPLVFPSGHMIFSVTDTNCPLVNQSRASRSDIAGTPTFSNVAPTRAPVVRNRTGRPAR
jgi:hypothetical protein